MAIYSTTKLDSDPGFLSFGFIKPPTEEEVAVFNSAVSKHTSLRKVEIINYGVLKELAQVTTPLLQTSSITNLNLIGVSFETETEIEKLAQIIRNNTHLFSLTFNGGAISESATEKIAPAIQTHPSLFQLGYHEKDKSVERVSFSVERHPPHLYEITLNKAIERLSPFKLALTSNFSLTSLNIYELTRGDDVGIAIAETLKTAIYLKSLFITNSGLTDASGEVIAKALLTNRSLNSLNLSNNEFTDQTGIVFAQTIQVNRSLRNLSLHGNPFTAAITGMFTDALSNSVLHSLHLNSMPFEHPKLKENEQNFEHHSLLMTPSLTQRLLGACKYTPADVIKQACVIS